MTVAEAIRQAVAALVTPEGDERTAARLEAEWLMAAALGVTRSALLLHRMGDPVPAGFAALWDRRNTGEPLAYIIGSQSFYGRDFAVSPAVLIPRADSECVVEAALGAKPDPSRILDCGTGSGALLLTLLAECQSARGVGIDRSPAALAVATANARALGLGSRADLRLADWTAADWAVPLGRFDLVIANPPYVEDGADLGENVTSFEPHDALFAGEEGLDDYRILIPQLPAMLDPGGVAVLEIGWQQTAPVSAIAKAAGAAVDVVHDLASRPRAIVLRFGVGKGPAKG